jgi:DNA-binding response OmpR family regulator
MTGEVTILVIEDDLGLADLIREEFGQRGWATVHCRTGAEAEEALASQWPTLALLDYALPDMTGAELLDRVMMPPFIVTTGAGDERIAVAMMKRGALDYLVKDALFLETLPSLVERALSHVGTERRLAEAEANLRLARKSLRQAQKMESLGLMAGGIAHDFNNLFQGLQGNLEVAIHKAPTGPTRPFLDKALLILAKASILTHRMLDFSGKSMRNSELLDLGQVVHGCLAEVAALPGPELHGQCQPDLPPIEGDGGQLAQVVTGLVLNAREAQKFKGAPIQVRVGLESPREAGTGVWIENPASWEPAVCLTVQDAGSGMSRAVLNRAFDPFFTTRKAGRGLGLSAALGILRSHDAGLWVATTPGAGSTFRVYFSPATRLDLAAPPPAPAADPARKTILLVDDDEDLQDALGEFLRDVLGYPLLQARDGVEAVDLYRQQRERIGLVLMDAMMPRLGGAEAFRQILELNAEAKGFLCSGFSEETGSRTAREWGFQGFLKKPFPLKALEEAIQNAMAPLS